MDMRSLNMWHDAKLDPPGKQLQYQTVLVVKKKMNGSTDVTFGKYMPEYAGLPTRWSTANGKGEVIFWMPIPKIPEVGDSVIIKTGYPEVKP